MKRIGNIGACHVRIYEIFLSCTEVVDEYSDVDPTTLSSLTLPGDSRSWESPEKADNVWRLFIQILLRYIPDFSPGM